MADAPAPRVILGSGSPRRATLLQSAGVTFTVEPIAIDEDTLVRAGDADPARVALRIARAKFDAFRSYRSADGSSVHLITADTLVACDGRILGKPSSLSDLRESLQTMSGRQVEIATAVCVGEPGATPNAATVLTRVALRRLTTAEIAGYVESGDGMDKAGGLALQGGARPFIDEVHGCWSNVLGLPLCATLRLLGAADGEARSGECSVASCGSRHR